MDPIQSILLLVIIFMLFRALKKSETGLNEVSKKIEEKINEIKEKIEKKEYQNDIEKLNLNAEKITQSVIAIEKYIENKDIKSNRILMYKYMYYLDQSKLFLKNDVFESLNLIQADSMLTSNKLFYIKEFTKLIYNNNLEFSDLYIEHSYDGDSIWFEIKEKEILSDYLDADSYPIDLIFTLKDGSKRTLEYSLLVPFDKFKEDYDKFIFKEHSFSDTVYYSKNKEDSRYRIILNDFFKYLKEVQDKYYNKFFFQTNVSVVYYETFLKNETCGYKDYSWQLDKSKFKYVDKLPEKEEIRIEDMNDNQLLEYVLDLYYKEIQNGYSYKKFDVVKHLDSLIIKNHAMANLVKGILYIEGIIVLKDLSKAKEYIQKAYDLGLQEPSIKIWNDNQL